MSLVLASISMVWAPNPEQITRIEIVTDTILRNGVIIKTDTVIKTISGPTKFVYKATENEAAPHIPGEYNAEQYIAQFKKIAKAGQQKYGIPASISLAQGLIESRAGTSKLAVNNNNHFGIKCFSRNCKKGHCTNFTDDTHKDFFRKFNSAWESWDVHGQLISSGRYAKLKKHGRDYRKWAYGLKACGYATDKAYADKLIGIIHTYSLQKLDK